MRNKGVIKINTKTFFMGLQNLQQLNSKYDLNVLLADSYNLKLGQNNSLNDGIIISTGSKVLDESTARFLGSIGFRDLEDILTEILEYDSDYQQPTHILRDSNSIAGVVYFKPYFTKQLDDRTNQTIILLDFNNSEFLV